MRSGLSVNDQELCYFVCRVRQPRTPPKLISFASGNPSPDVPCQKQCNFPLVHGYFATYLIRIFACGKNPPSPQGKARQRGAFPLNRKGFPKGKTCENLPSQIFIGLPLGTFLCERFFSCEKKCGKNRTSKEKWKILHNYLQTR